MKKKLLIIIPIIIAVVAFVFVYRYYNKEDETTTLTVTEKRWVQDHADQTYDFEVVNDYPLYGVNGEGVIFSFLDDFEKNIGLEFNRIPYLKESTTKTKSFRIRILDNDKELGKKVARKLDKNSMASQAIGGAVGHNPISIIIPCHRVIGTNGTLTGYAGGIEKKAYLLELEKNSKLN